MYACRYKKIYISLVIIQISSPTRPTSARNSDNFQLKLETKFYEPGYLCLRIVLYATCVQSITFFHKWEFTYARAASVIVPGVKQVIYTKFAYIIFCNSFVSVKYNSILIYKFCDILLPLQQRYELFPTVGTYLLFSCILCFFLFILVMP